MNENPGTQYTDVVSHTMNFRGFRRAGHTPIESVLEAFGEMIGQDGWLPSDTKDTIEGAELPEGAIPTTLRVTIEEIPYE